MIGVGVIIRDHEGSVVSAMSKCIPFPLGPLEAKAKAMDEATLFARDVGVRDIIFELESTDAAGRVPHPHPTRPDAGRNIQCGCSLIDVASAFFFFFLGFTLTRLDSRQLGLIRADTARFVPNRLRFVPNRLRFAPNRANSDRIRPYQPATDTAETGRKQPKLALNMAEKAKIITLEA